MGILSKLAGIALGAIGGGSKTKQATSVNSTTNTTVNVDNNIDVTGLEQILRTFTNFFKQQGEKDQKLNEKTAIALLAGTQAEIIKDAEQIKLFKALKLGIFATIAFLLFKFLVKKGKK